MSAQKPYAATIGPWLTANLRKGWSAPLTGQDWPALKAIVEIVNTWTSSDGEGREHCVAAFRAMVLTMQPGCRYLAFHAVAHVADWSHRWQIWRAAGLDDALVIGKPGCKYGPETRHHDAQLERAATAVETTVAGGVS